MLIAAAAIVGLISGTLSAAFWFWSAYLETPLPMAYLSGPPPDVAKRITLQSRLNRLAAICAGVTMLCQGFAGFLMVQS